MDDKKLSSSNFENDIQSIKEKLDEQLKNYAPESARIFFDSFSIDERTRLVTSYHGKKRLDLILMSENAMEIVRNMPAPELWITIKEVGEEDSIELLQMAHPSQFQHFFDLEWWHEDKIDPLQVAWWLKLMNEASPQTVVNWFDQAQSELLITTFSKFFNVYKTDPDDEGSEPWRSFKNIWTLDGTYHVHFLDPYIAPTIQRALSAIRAEKEMKYYALLDGIDFNEMVEVENSAKYFRDARLADYGFVDFTEALDIYAPIYNFELKALEKERIGKSKIEIEDEPKIFISYPVVYGETPPLLQNALSLIDDKEALEEIWAGLATLASRIQIADKMDMTKLVSAKNALKKAAAFVDMGLQRWAEGDPEKAALILAGQNIQTIFRAGHTRLLKLGHAAQNLKKEEWISKIDYYEEMLSDEGPVLSGLLLERPKYYDGLDEDGAPVYREFFNNDEISRAELALHKARFTGRLFFDGLGITISDIEFLKSNYSGVVPVWEVVFLTAVSQALSGNDFKFIPLELDDAKSALDVILTKKLHAARLLM